MATLELPWAAYDAPTTWYRLPSVKVAFVVSLLLHAAAIVLLPNLRVPEPKVAPPLVVELVPQPPPPPLVKPEVPPPPPVVKAIPRRIQPPPVPEVKPEPKPEPPPIETRTPPPPQPIAVPPRPVQPEPQAAAPVRVEPPPVRVEAPAPVQPPAPPQPPALDANVLHDYSAIVSGAVAKKKAYPRLALTRRWQGTTDLKLQVAADGNLKALSVTHSSGFEVLDDQAMKMVKEAMPLPVLPDALRGREFAIDIPVAFKLQD
jgi:protein TonB